jgi:hypothetical protein
MPAAKQSKGRRRLRGNCSQSGIGEEVLDLGALGEAETKRPPESPGKHANEDYVVSSFLRVAADRSDGFLLSQDVLGD